MLWADDVLWHSEGGDVQPTALVTLVRGGMEGVQHLLQAVVEKSNAFEAAATGVMGNVTFGSTGTTELPRAGEDSTRYDHMAYCPEGMEGMDDAWCTSC